MTSTLKWSEEALEDIESIATYIEKDFLKIINKVIAKHRDCKFYTK